MDKKVIVNFQAMVSSMGYRNPELFKKTKDELLAYAWAVDCRRDGEIEMFRQTMEEIDKIHKMSKRFRIGDIVKVLGHDSDDNCSFTQYYLIKGFNKCQSIYFSYGYNVEVNEIKFDFCEKYSDREYKDIDNCAEEVKIIGTIIGSGKYGIINNNGIEYWSDGVGTHIRFHSKNIPTDITNAS